MNLHDPRSMDVAAARPRGVSPRVYRLPAIVALFALSGCASLWEGRLPSSRTSVDPARRDQVWSAALDQLAIRAFPIAIADRQRGIIQTATVVRPGRVPCGFVTCRYRDRVEILVGDDASVTVSVTRQLSTLYVSSVVPLVSEEWTAPSRWQKATLEGIKAEQDEILRAIVQ